VEVFHRLLPVAGLLFGFFVGRGLVLAAELLTVLLGVTLIYLAIGLATIAPLGGYRLYHDKEQGNVTQYQR
jgi:hypothetical protein